MAKKDIVFNVDVRPRTGTGGAREARKSGLVPGVLYGGDLAPVAITLQKGEVLKAIESGVFLNTVATLVYKGEKQLVVPQDIQLHPVTDQPQHVDLFRVTADQKIKISVPVHFKGEDLSPGLKKGGTLNVVRHAVELLVPAGDIPEFLEASVEGLEIGDAVRISSIKLPAGITPTITDRDFVVATIAGRSSQQDTTDTAAPTAAEVPATNVKKDDPAKAAAGNTKGPAAKPAAGGAKPAGGGKK
jgi:large subunit ribosomal protein L25